MERQGRTAWSGSSAKCQTLRSGSNTMSRTVAAAPSHDTLARIMKTEPQEAILILHGPFALPVLREAYDTGVGERLGKLLI